MKRVLSLLILFTSLILSIIGCKDDKVAMTMVDKSKHPSKRIVSVNHTEDITDKLEENDNINASSNIQNSIEEVVDSVVIADYLVRKAMETKPTAKVVSEGTEDTKKPTVKPDKNPKPNLVKSVPIQYLPKISFDTLTHDFGEIVEGDIIKYNFTFTNTGKSNLSIKKATATCGCTTPSFPFIDIKPGETGFIGVTYSSVNKNGDQKPEIIVYSNAKPREITLYLTGTVKPKTQVEKEEDESGINPMPQDTTKQ